MRLDTADTAGVPCHRESNVHCSREGSRRPIRRSSLVAWRVQAKEQGIGLQGFREWIARLERAGELVTITQPVSPYLEMAEIADRAAKLPATAKRGAGGPALLFENVTGYPGARC